MSVPAGHAAHAGLNVGGGKSESRECAEWNDTAGPAGVGACGGRTGVVMGCDEPLARRWWGSGEGWPGLVWCKPGLSAGISGWSGLLLVGWRARGCTGLSH